MNRTARFPTLLCALCACYQAACGQKGPPLAPIVYLPRPVTEVVAKRVENEVVLQFTVPTVNTDESGPADLRRIEVYAHTGPLPAPTDFLKYGTLVASVDIQQPKTEEERTAEGQSAEGQRAEGKGQAVVVPEEDTAGLAVQAETAKAGLTEQGAKTSVREMITPKHMEIGPMPPTKPLPPPAENGAVAVVIEKIETPGTVNFDLAPQRYYTIVGVSESRNRRGPFFGPVPVALIEPLSPPEKVDLAYTVDTLSLTWPPQPEDRLTGAPSATGAAALPALPAVDRETAGTIEFYSDIETDGTEDVLVALIGEKVTPGAKPKPRPPATAAPPPTPRFGYNVYDAGAMGVTSATVVPAVPIAPLNATLLTAPGFTDPRVEFGVERCYVVRRVEMAGAVATEGAPSAAACITPVDTFPPAPPKSLAHISAGSGVSLLWEANTEPDLAGYLVLRGEAPGDKLSPLTPEPIADTSFLDSTARRGRTYVYEVIAVDRSTPPNLSEPSNRVEETIR